MNYLQNLWNALDLGSLQDTLLRVASVLICLILHETCHGVAAFFLGDPTAKRNHRLSLNPLRHIDWLGLAAMVLTGVGWAKPVPVNPNYFKRPKVGMAITALAGPASNLLLALWLLLGVRVMIDGAASVALKAMALQYAFTATAVEVSPNASGRVMLPQALREFAEIDGSALVIGMNNRIEIWCPQRFDAFISAQQDTIAEALTLLRL